MKRLKLICVLTFCVAINNVPGLFAGEEESGVDLNTVVVTASRLQQYDYKVAGNITVITAEQIEASGAQAISDVLKEVEGINVYDSGSVKTATLDIRGFGDTASRNVLVLVNDRKINAVDISGPDLLQIPIEAVERIEIIRGAGSVLYGDNAVGGVVNIITKQGRGDLSGKIGGTYGSYDSRSSDFQVSGEYKDFSYFLYSKYLDQRGYRANSDVLAKDFNFRTGYKVSEKISADINVGRHKDNYGLPGGLSDTALATMGRKESTTPNDFASTDDFFAKLTLDINPWTEDMYFGDFVLDLSYRDREVFDSFSGFETTRTIVTRGLSIKYIFDRQIFSKNINFVTGLDYYDYENDLIGSGSNTDDLTISKAEKGVYTFLEYELFEHLFVNGGTRYHRAEYDFSQRNIAVDEQQRPDEWVSMGGLKYEYARGSNVHMNVQQTFRFLATDEWYSSFSGTLDTSLKQQTGIQYEAGIKHNFDDIIVVNVTPYLMETENEIFFDPSQGFFGANSNYDKIRRVGVETGGRLDLKRFIDIGLLSKFEFFGNYTYQNPKFADGPNDGKDVPLAPRHQAGIGFLAEFWEHYDISILGRYVGERFAVNDTMNTTPAIKPYLVTDLKLAYKAGHFECFVALNNLFNELYFTSVTKSSTSTTKSYSPAPERNFNIGMNMKF